LWTTKQTGQTTNNEAEALVAFQGIKLLGEKTSLDILILGDSHIILSTLRNNSHYASPHINKGLQRTIQKTKAKDVMENVGMTLGKGTIILRNSKCQKQRTGTSHDHSPSCKKGTQVGKRYHELGLF
jgi:ribonuclease HI